MSAGEKKVRCGYENPSARVEGNTIVLTTTKRKVKPRRKRKIGQA